MSCSFDEIEQRLKKSGVPLEPSQRPVAGIYRHFKGGLYRVYGLACKTDETGAHVVYEDDKGMIWIRPIHEFVGPAPRGIEGPRFQLIKEIRQARISIDELLRENK